MSDKAPYVPFYTSDFLGGTSGLTASTKGVYITLLCLMYEAEAPLKQSWDTLARRCGCTLPAFKKAVQSLCEDGKMTASEDGLWSEKCEKHLTHRRERQNSAKAAANKRWENTKQNQGQADATALRPVCQPEPEPEITTPNGVDGEPVDFAKAIFDRGVKFLMSHGTPERHARSMVGQWRKKFSEREVFDAFREASKAGVTDPIPWIRRHLEGPSKPSQVVFNLADFEEQA